MASRVVVVGLGPGDPALLTQAVREAIDRVPVRYIRTGRHPSAVAVPDAVSFDSIYEQSLSLDEVYEAIVDALAGAPAPEVLYAVPGSPMVAERTVELLRADGRIEVSVLPSLSFLDLAWEKLGVDPLASGVCLIDGHRFAVEAAGQAGPLLVAQCDSKQVLSEIKLAVPDQPGRPGPVTVLQRLGLPDESVSVVPWEDLDRAVEPDHLTSLCIPHLAAPVGAEHLPLAELVRPLRQRCAWH